MSMIPTVALVGRPNVGKSTLFNRLTGTRDALVANHAGLTRDRKYGEANVKGKRFIVVDTGGISGEEEGIDSAMADQSLQAMQEADIVMFLVDCRDGVTPADIQIANHIRQLPKPSFLVANKIDGLNPDVAGAAFYELGLGEVHPVAAEHGRGISQLMDDVLEHIPEYVPAEDLTNHGGIKMAIIGRPNVGKSTLVNRLLGEDRVVVYDHPGTTRDSIYIHYERLDKPYTIIDTAGVRRRKNVKLVVEKFSIVKTLQAIEDANVVIMLMDATEGVVDQDLHIMGYAIDKGRALVVALNKWDGLEQDHKQHIKSELERRLRFVEFADIHFISALHGTGVGNLYKSVERAFKSATEKYTANFLTQVLEKAVHTHQPPLVRGQRIKLRYAHAGGHNPPIIVIHGNLTSEVPNHYVRYLEKTFRKELDLHGTPIRIEFKTSENPFAGRKNKLNPRHETKKRGPAQQVKKAPPSKRGPQTKKDQPSKKTFQRGRKKD